MTTFNHDAAIEAAAQVVSLNEHSPTVTRIWLTFDKSEVGTLYATDSYRAVRIKLPSHPFDSVGKPISWVPGKGKVTWEMFVENAEPTPKLTMPSIDPLYAKTESYDRFELIRLSGSMIERPIAKWAYFNGDRRKPDGIIRLQIHAAGLPKPELDIVRGMRVYDERIGRYFNAWDDGDFGYEPSKKDANYTLGTVLPDRAILSNQMLGVYAATYLAPFDLATEMRWSGSTFRPLYFSTHHGAHEHLVMPIRL